MQPLFLGLDIGTSGARACAMTVNQTVVALGSSDLDRHGSDRRDPHVWWSAARAAVVAVLDEIDRGSVLALSVDGTSGSMLPIDRTGAPVAAARMYNDPCEDRTILERIAAVAPAGSAARGATSGLARAIGFQAVPSVSAIVHQADWIAGQFSGRFVSDENNALKTGYDPQGGSWPDWLPEAGMRVDLLPEVHPAGEVTGRIAADAAAEFGLSPATLVVAGTTDGCASFLATGASEIGDGVTALGSTLTLKILSDKPVSAPQYGIYSHKVLGAWLAGGASNSGGNVLLAHFAVAEIERLSALIDTDTPTDLAYYPLTGPGERFPHADPDFPPVLDPRPTSDAEFLKGLLDGIARIEQTGYRRLEELGAPGLRSVRTVGGGARNPAWRQLRAARLDVPFLPAESAEAAAGTACLALLGALHQGVV